MTLRTLYDIFIGMSRVEDCLFDLLNIHNVDTASELFTLLETKPALWHTSFLDYWHHTGLMCDFDVVDQLDKIQACLTDRG